MCDETLDIARDCFEKMLNKQVERIKSLKRKDFNINPFTISMLSQIGFGDSDSYSKARSLVYPRVFGTSLATSFGTRMQHFCVDAGFAIASGVKGMDIEFDDKETGRHMYCQLKAGPTTINKDDVDPICDSFTSARRLLKTNGYRDLQEENFILGILYGKHKDISHNYKTIESKGWNIWVGKKFWTHLTGDENYYYKLIDVAQEVAQSHNAHKHVEDLIERIANEL